MGGFDRSGLTNDTFVLDTRTEKIEKVQHNTASMQQFKFTSENNASVTVAENVVVALVMGNHVEPHLIQFVLETSSLSIVHKFDELHENCLAFHL